MLALLSTRIGTLAGRLGSRRFLVAGPLLMATGLLWYSRIPADSAPWKASIDDPASLIPPLDTITDILPYALLFGLGISFVVAPLTSTLMGSISGRYSGVGSAINNSISRVGQPLLGALIFIPISAAYYASLDGATGLDTTDSAVRRMFQPLNPPGGRRDRRAGHRLEPGVDPGLPARDVGVRRAADRRRARVVVRPARAAPRAATRARRP